MERLIRKQSLSKTLYPKKKGGNSMSVFVMSLFLSIATSVGDNSLVYPHEMRKSTGFSLNAPLIHYIKGPDSKITLYGFIDKFSASEFERITNEDHTIKELIIDSQGGDIESSIKIARILRKKEMSLVVDGRCLSSCASFLFTAAKRKTVLPMSIVGIHDFSYLIKNKNGNQWVSGNEIESQIKKTNDQDEITKYKEKKLILQNFNSEMNIKESLFVTFNSYVSRRKKMFEVEDIKAKPSTSTCPSIHFWILNKSQLESIGVVGIEKFWFPKDQSEIIKAALENGIEDNTKIYAGSSEQLNDLCIKNESNWVHRLLRSLSSTFE